MRVRVDRDLCCSYRACEQECPQLFKHDSDGIVFVENEQVPIGLEGAAAAAASACPQGAIRVIDEQR
jgi:ferredoxin